ncbi:MAG TPA: hypothetical protein ENH18_00915 [Nitrospirae bacterium]|nr:hypothetical protein [Nitrospirota bacterium]HEW80907.1 hypothetical protein [Nitrospirota bacterium]
MKRVTLIFTIIFLGILFISPIGTQASEPKDDVYKVGVGDMLRINVLGHKDLDIAVTVAVDGTISFPNIGSVYIKDLSLMQVQELIIKRLSDGYIKFPSVSVSLLKGVSQKIFVHGEVAGTGAISFEKDMTIVKALSIVGGIREDGRYGKLRLRRKQKGASGYESIIEAEINNGIIMNKEIEDTLLYPDDILIVERNETFLIQGEASHRGRFVLEKGMTVLRAMLEAGGAGENGKYGKVVIRRKTEDESERYKKIAESRLNDGDIEKSEVEDMVLQPDDILIIERNETYLIQGEASSRGRFVLEKDMTVLRALLEAGGVGENGKYGKVVIRRKIKGKAGGYEKIAEARLNAGVIENSEVEDLLLQPEDILIVEQNETYFIYGEVNLTGEFVLKNDMTVFKALTIAKGFTKWGSASRVKVLRLPDNGKEFITINVNIEDVIDGDASEDLFLQPGDVIMVSSGIL